MGGSAADTAGGRVHSRGGEWGAKGQVEREEVFMATQDSHKVQTKQEQTGSIRHLTHLL